MGIEAIFNMHYNRNMYSGLIVLFLSAILLIPPAYAGQLASVQASAGIGAYVPALSRVWLRVSLSDPPWGCWFDSPPACYQIWYREISAASIGTTSVIDASTNPEFNSMAEKLANGANNVICLSMDTAPVYSSGGGTCYTQSKFAGAASLHGSNITSINLTIDSLTFGAQVFPARPPALGSVVGSTARVGLTMAINGVAVPEPNSAGLTVCGLLLAMPIWPRSRRRKPTTAGTR